jgi:hypothetical protein
MHSNMHLQEAAPQSDMSEIATTKSVLRELKTRL